MGIQQADFRNNGKFSKRHFDWPLFLRKNAVKPLIFSLIDGTLLYVVFSDDFLWKATEFYSLWIN